MAVGASVALKIESSHRESEPQEEGHSLSGAWWNPLLWVGITVVDPKRWGNPVSRARFALPIEREKG